MIRLCDLLDGLETLSISGNAQTQISGICYDSRKAGPGSLFVCIKGYVTDGHKFISQAVEAGAAAVMIQDGSAVRDDGIVYIKVPDTRIGLAHVSASFFGYPSKNISMIGITGTKGKTTTAFMIDSILAAAGTENALIGTILTKIGKKEYTSARTTPESYDLQEIFSKCVESNVRSCVMEVSSQGLKLNRVYGLRFETGVFTNLYNDHIGPAEHEDMNDYVSSKAMLFGMCDNAVVNIDDAYSGVMLDKLSGYPGVRIFTVGIENEADITAADITKVSEVDKIGTSFTLKSPWYEGKIFVSLPGVFNVYNALCAIAVAGVRGIDQAAVRAGLAGSFVKGRVQPVRTGRDFQVIIDYAHNAASLESLLETMREYTAGKLVCVFGCGGNRARSRRFEMGEVSGRSADMTVITSDNPRSEPPESIIADIETGIKKTEGRYIRITDRTDAIRWALNKAGTGDVIVIAGKGHETYQEFADRTIHYDDHEIASMIISEMDQL